MKLLRLGKILKQATSKALAEPPSGSAIALERLELAINDRNGKPLCSEPEAKFVTYLANIYRGDRFAHASFGYLNALILSQFMERTVLVKTKGLVYASSGDVFYDHIGRGGQRRNLLPILSAINPTKRPIPSRHHDITTLILCFSNMDEWVLRKSAIEENVVPAIDFDRFDLLVGAPKPSSARRICDEIVGDRQFAEVCIPSLQDDAQIGGLCLRCNS